MLVLELALLAVGIALLVAGAAGLVEAGSSLGRRVGISPLWIGLTVVAIGTSAPELVVSALASMSGRGELAVANVVGSNILNILIVLGCTAAIAPVAVSKLTVRRDISLVLAASLATWALAADGQIHPAEGWLLIALAIPYTYHVYRAERSGYLPADEPPTHLDKLPVAVQGLVGAAGIALLVFGGDMVVERATNVGMQLGISERVLGLTVIAIGTSLPELATSLMAAAKGKTDLAIGNLIGSNLLNLFLVLGVAASIGSLPVGPDVLRVDMAAMCIAALMMLRFAATKGRVSRLEGALLLGTYAAYLALVL